jgi:hypothetical protein
MESGFVQAVEAHLKNESWTPEFETKAVSIKTGQGLGIALRDDQTAKAYTELAQAGVMHDLLNDTLPTRYNTKLATGVNSIPTSAETKHGTS